MSCKYIEQRKKAHVLMEYGVDCYRHRCPYYGIKCNGPSATKPTERKLAGIRTLAYNVAQRDEMDDKVNELLAKGWTLRKRELIVSQDSCLLDYIYIELEVYEHD